MFISLLKKYSILLKRSLVESINFTAGKFLVLNLPVLLYLSVRYFLMTLVGLFFSLINSKERSDLIKSFKLSISNGYRKGFFINIISGVLYGIACILNYESLSLLPLSMFIVIENCFKTILGTLFGYFLLKEVINFKIVIYILIILFGSFLVLDIDFTSLNLDKNFYLGLVFLFCGALLACIDGVLIKKVSKDISSSFIVLVKNTFTTLIVVVLFIILNDNSFSNNSDIFLHMEYMIYFLFIFTVFGGFYVRYATVKSIRLVGIYETNLFFNLSTVLGVLIAMFVFQEWFNIIQWLGFIIVCTFLYLNSTEKVKLETETENKI